MSKTLTFGRVTAAMLFAVAALFIGITTAFAAAPNWDTTGSYEVAFTCDVGCSGTYNHDLTLVQDGSGNLTGSGGNPVGAHVYNWALTSGTVDADAITFAADYSSTADAVTPQTTMNVVGTIVGGSMSGTWTDNYQGTARSGTWSTVSGTADPISNTPACSMDDTTFDTFTLGSVNGQHGWAATGPYDQAIVDNTYGYPTFGCKSLRISDAVTSGSFGDWVFSNSVANEAGETTAQNGGMSGGVRQTRFEAQFDLASTQSTQQPGMHLSVSPDRGDGARMSYLRFDDMADGIHVFFDDYQNNSGGEPAGTCNTGDNFVETEIATLTRTPHTIKFVMDFVDGQNNDIVNIYIDGVLEHTGTSWEGYFNYCESNPTRTVDSLIFQSRTGSGPLTNPADQGKGFLVDNMSLVSGATPVAPLVTVTIDKFIDGAMATTGSATGSAFPMTATWNATNIGAGSGGYDLDADGFNGDPTPYQAITSMMTSGADYSTSEVVGGPVVGATCQDGKPYALSGYSVGDTFAEAQAAATSATAPAFTDITTDKYVIVRNVTCVQEPPAPPVPPANACATPNVAPDGYTLQKGTSGNNTVALAPNTMFVGKGGNDTVTGGDGNYIVCTAGGNDTITLGHGNSTVDAGNGNNSVTVGNGEGAIKAGGGNDTVVAGDGARTVNVGGGNNKVTTGGGAQDITAGGGNDEIRAGAGADTVNAGGGNNKVWGEDGADMLTSAAGNDQLDGGNDTDTCQAGGGNNTKTSCEL